MYQVIEAHICECYRCKRTFALVGTEVIDDIWTCPKCNELNSQVCTIKQTTHVIIDDIKE